MRIVTWIFILEPKQNLRDKIAQVNQRINSLDKKLEDDDDEITNFIKHNNGRTTAGKKISSG